MNGVEFISMVEGGFSNYFFKVIGLSLDNSNLTHFFNNYEHTGIDLRAVSFVLGNALLLDEWSIPPPPPPTVTKNSCIFMSDLYLNS